VKTVSVPLQHSRTVSPSTRFSVFLRALSLFRFLPSLFSKSLESYFFSSRFKRCGNLIILLALATLPPPCRRPIRVHAPTTPPIFSMKGNSGRSSRLQHVVVPHLVLPSTTGLHFLEIKLNHLGSNFLLQDSFRSFLSISDLRQSGKASSRRGRYLLLNSEVFSFTRPHSSQHAVSPRASTTSLFLFPPRCPKFVFWSPRPFVEFGLSSSFLGFKAFSPFRGCFSRFSRTSPFSPRSASSSFDKAHR